MASEFNSIEDLAFSRSFRNWVLNDDAAERGYWENWMARNPDKAEMVKAARAIIYALHVNPAVLPEDEIEEEVRKAQGRLKEAPRYIPLDGPEGRERRWRGVLRPGGWWVVGVIAGVIGTGAFFYFREHSHPDVLQIFLGNHKKGAVHREEAEFARDRTFNLPDGSMVRLGKTGKLYYSTDWSPGSARREVFLRGDAYFEIRKNPVVPFYVYTDQVIIKVLGTSFVVRSGPTDSQTTITVMTGKVSVYREEDFLSHSMAGGARVGVDGQAPAGMVLTPNQEGVYDQDGDRLHKTLAEMPEPLGESPDMVQVFDTTPVRRVFGQLQELYGIPIQYDDEAVGHCPVTVNLRKESFYDRLTVICNAIGGTYEVIDGNVVVTAPGCK